MYEHAAEDIWGLGCCLYEMVMGKSPWSECDNVFAVYFTLGNLKKGDDHLLITQVKESGRLDEDGMAFLAACLQVDPADRPTSLILSEMKFCIPV
jgi:serine/threonine protein kinase